LGKPATICCSLFPGSGIFADTATNIVITKGIASIVKDSESCDLTAHKHSAKVIPSATYPGTDPIKAIVIPNSSAKTTAYGEGKSLSSLAIESIGHGKSITRKATVEKVYPVRVKFTALAKSNGRYIPKKARSETTATTTPLPYRVYKNALIRPGLFNKEAVAKYSKI
jgi:hypothetical protein